MLSLFSFRFTRKRFVFFCAASSVVIGGGVLTGWAVNTNIFAFALPGYFEMRLATAAAFLLSGLALCSTLLPASNRLSRILPAATGLVVAGFAALLFTTSIGSLSAGFDRFVPIDASAGNIWMSPNAALVFLFVGASLVLLRVGGRYKYLSEPLAVIGLVVTYAAILGYLYNADELDGILKINGMTPLTAFAFVVVSAAIVVRNSRSMLVRLLASDTLGGAAARRLIPSVILIPTFIGWLRVQGQDIGLYDTGFGSAMSTFTLVLLMLAIVVFYSRAVHAADKRRLRAEAEVGEKEMRYRELFDYSQGLICIHDLDGVLSTVNRAACQLFGYREDELIGRNLRDFVPAERKPHFDSYLRQVTHEGLAQGLLELASREGKPVILRFNNVLASEEGKEPYVLGHAQDVTELLATQRALKNLSLTDDLTGLHNRRGFVTLAEQQIKLERHEGTARGLVLLFADLDGLKRINDTHGHEAGSDAIIEFSRIVKSVLRSSDLVARWGGDEFVILTIGSKDEHVGIMSDRIYERLRHFNASSGKPYELACSIGLARVPTKGDKTFEKIIAEADEAMYAEKRRRKEAADVSARLILT